MIRPRSYFGHNSAPPEGPSLEVTLFFIIIPKIQGIGSLNTLKKTSSLALCHDNFIRPQCIRPIHYQMVIVGKAAGTVGATETIAPAAFLVQGRARAMPFFVGSALFL